jgi:hypothetical protein
MSKINAKNINSVTDLQRYFNSSLLINGYDFSWIFPISVKTLDEESIEYLNLNAPNSNRFILLNLGEHLKEATTLINNCISKRNEIFELETIAYTKAIEYIQLIFGKDDEQNLNFLNIKALYNLSNEPDFNTFNSSLDARTELLETLLRTRFALHNQIGNPLNYGERVQNLRKQYNETIRIIYERLFAIKRTLKYVYNQDTDLIPSYLDVANNIFCLDFWVRNVITTYETNSQYDYIIEKTILFTDNNGLISGDQYFNDFINISQHDFEFNINSNDLGFDQTNENARMLGLSVNVLSGHEQMYPDINAYYVLDSYFPPNNTPSDQHYFDNPKEVLHVEMYNSNLVAARRTENVNRTNNALKKENTTFSCKINSPLQTIPLLPLNEPSLNGIDLKLKHNFEKNSNSERSNKKFDSKENTYYQPKLSLLPITLPNKINYGDIQPIQGVSVKSNLRYYNDNFLNNISPLGKWVLNIGNSSKKNYNQFSGEDYSLKQILDVAITFKIGIRKF